MRSLGKRVCLDRHRGFESLPIHQTTILKFLVHDEGITCNMMSQVNATIPSTQPTGENSVQEGSAPHLLIGSLSSHTVTQIFNPLLQRLSNVISLPTASHFFSYRGSSMPSTRGEQSGVITSSMNVLESLSTRATHHVTRGVESLISALPSSEHLPAESVLQNSGRHIANTFVNHVISNAKQVGDRIRALSGPDSSLVQPQQRAVSLDDSAVEMQDEGDYVLVNQPGVETPNTNPAAKSKPKQFSLTHDELNSIIDHSHNVSRAAVNAAKQDRLIESEIEEEDQRNIRELSGDISAFGARIDNIAQAIEREAQEIETNLNKSTDPDQT
jgi:hypothetical protein